MTLPGERSVSVKVGRLAAMAGAAMGLAMHVQPTLVFGDYVFRASLSDLLLLPLLVLPAIVLIRAPMALPWACMILGSRTVPRPEYRFCAQSAGARRSDVLGNHQACRRLHAPRLFVRGCSDRGRGWRAGENGFRARFRFDDSRCRCLVLCPGTSASVVWRDLWRHRRAFCRIGEQSARGGLDASACALSCHHICARSRFQVRVQCLVAACYPELQRSDADGRQVPCGWQPLSVCPSFWSSVPSLCGSWDWSWRCRLALRSR